MNVVGDEDSINTKDTFFKGTMCDILIIRLREIKTLLCG